MTTVRMRLLPAIALLAGISAATAAEAPAQPAAPPGFDVPREQVIATIKRIAIIPVVMPGNLRGGAEERTAIARRIEGAVAAMLREGGFEVVEAESMRVIRQQATATMGQLYDPLTGTPDSDKLKALREFTDSEFDAGNAVDGYVRVAIVRELAFTEGAWANWDGSRQMAFGAEKPPFGVSLDKIPIPLRALSMALTLEDRSRKVVYGRVRGIQLTEVLRFQRGKGYVASALDAATLLSDGERERQVLEVVLGPLARGSIPATGPLQLPREAPLPDLAPAEYVDADTLNRQYKRIGLMPAQFAGDAERVKAAPRYQALIAEQLRKHGYDVVLADEAASAWEAERRAAGGFYDPATGARDEARWRAARQKIIEAFRQQHGLEAVIVPEFENTFAPLQGGWINWDGNKEMVLVMGKGLASFMNLDTVLAGSLPALSLVLHVQDARGEDIFVGRGGVHALVKIDKGRVVDKAESDFFKDPERDVDAAAAATKGFRPKAKQKSSRPM